MPNYPRSSRARYFPNPVEFAASGVAVDVPNGNIRLAGGGSLVTSNNGDITLAPNGTGITKIGDAGTTSHSLSSNDDLFVTGKQEVDGILWCDYIIDSYNIKARGNYIKADDTAGLYFGDDNDIQIGWDDTAGLLDTTVVDSMALPCVQTANLATLQTNNTVAFSVDETNSELDITVKQSDGTVKSGTVTLA